MGFFASVDGVVTPAVEARVSVLDTGFTFGDAVYETLRTYGGRPFELPRHLARLRESGRRVGIPVPGDDGAWEARIRAVLEPAGNPESYVRLLVSRGVGDVSYRFERVKGPTVVVIVKPYEAPPERAYAEGVDVILSSFRRNPPAALDPGIKSCNLLNNVLATREAQDRGAFEPILLNVDGEVAEGAGSNVFAVRGGTLATPPLSAGILPGVTRALVLEQAAALGIPVSEDAMRVSDFLGAEEAFLTSTLKEVLPIRAIDGRPVGEGRPGLVTRRILSAYREYARSQ